jgi:preprotein translocase subunit SecY
MASNVLTDIFRIKDLRDRILFTLGILIVFRLGATLPIPGINVNALKLYFMAEESTGLASITDYFDFFAGGAFKNFSVFMLGIMPYISMSIIMQLLVLVFPKLKKISEEEGGKKKIHRYTRYGTVLVCLIQSYAVTIYADHIPDALTMDKMTYTFVAMLTVSVGTLFLMWLGEQITQRGIGNGISMLIFAGIVARIPDAIYLLLQKIQRRELNPVYVILVFAMFVIVVALVVIEQTGQRKIPVHYAKRVVGRRCTAPRTPTYHSR